ncbi:MAG: hypothetical protein M1816_008048 [Peltula sp. TS41687]|nr:MAG: hypothetical protein M1816_008048 [Peltula sp. TS41687]
MTSPTPPLRNRPDLRLNITPLNRSGHGSPNVVTPFGLTTYSPFRSASLKPPTPYGGGVRFLPKRVNAGSMHYTWYRVRQLLASRALWFLVALSTLLFWWSKSGGWYEIDSAVLRSAAIGQGLFHAGGTAGLQFFPASNPKIHVGCIPASHVQSADGWKKLIRMTLAAGVYFDISINSTSSLYLALRNAPTRQTVGLASLSSAAARSLSTPTFEHLSFHSAPLTNNQAASISLLVRIDQEEYILLPNSTSLVSIRVGDLERHVPHDVRIIAPMTDDGGRGVVQLEGLWLDKGGKLLRVEGSQLGEEVEEEDSFHAENDNIGRNHRIGLGRLLHGGRHEASKEKEQSPDDEDIEGQARLEGRKRMLEIITDTPGFLGRQKVRNRTGGGDGLLGGVMGWEYLLGEMFGVDHISIGLEGMCLTQNCIGGTGQPAGIGDVFFRSGPANSEYFEHPWMFHSYVPDVMLLNLGTSDHYSFENHKQEYNKTSWELYERFEDSYVNLVKAIRQLAYPKHPQAATSSSSYGTSTSLSAPASIPIFLMRPFRGQFEHAVQGAVRRLRDGGDSSVFLLDTSGWLNVDDTSSEEDRDFQLDESTSPPRWRLTQHGNQRVAIFLHMHVCRYLAADEDQCAFLPPEVYQGRAFSPDSASFDWQMETAKEKKLKEAFWEEG